MLITELTFYFDCDAVGHSSDNDGGGVVMVHVVISMIVMSVG